MGLSLWAPSLACSYRILFLKILVCARTLCMEIVCGDQYM